MLDMDNTPFRTVKYWADRAMSFFDLEGYIILKSSENCYHVVFNRKVSWLENVKIVSWVCIESHSPYLVKWFLLQCRKGEPTLRVSAKGVKPSPRIVYRFGSQDGQIQGFIEFRKLIKRIVNTV